MQTIGSNINVAHGIDLFSGNGRCLINRHVIQNPKINDSLLSFMRKFSIFSVECLQEKHWFTLDLFLLIKITFLSYSIRIYH